MNASAATMLGPPEQIFAGRYRVEQLLGHGGKGAVYAVHDTRSGKRLARERLAAGASPTNAALFAREYEMLGSLKHPSVIDVANRLPRSPEPQVMRAVTQQQKQGST